jgi:hypothetical protein
MPWLLPAQALLSPLRRTRALGPYAAVTVGIEHALAFADLGKGVACELRFAIGGRCGRPAVVARIVGFRRLAITRRA